MKRMIFLFVLILSFLACSNNDDENNENQSIIGTWELVEKYGSSAGGDFQWMPVEDGYYYTFSKNGNFSSNRFSECQTGNYSLTDTQLILDYSCEGFTTGIETPEGTFVENYRLKDNLLFLSPTYLNCDEGCEYKFEKVNEDK